MPEIKMRHYQTGALDAFAAGVRNGMRNQLITLPTGTGKCFARGTSILMYDGTVKAVEDIIVGDLLMGPDSSSRKVLSLGRGREMLYRITPEKGNSYVVNESHILSLKMTKKVSKGKNTTGRQCAAGTIVNIRVSEYLECNKAFKESAKGYRTGVEFAAQTEILGAYLLAFWLGGGDRSGPLEDREVADYFGVFDSVGNKCIPQRYKSNTREVRLKLLAGLIDANGHSVKGGYTLMFEGRTFANDVAFVARSLGLAAYVKYCRDMSAATSTKSYGFRVSISGDCDVIPLRSFSKTQLDPKREDALVHGIKVKAVGVGDYYGFEINGDRLFLLADFTVVHNTVLFVRAARHAGLKGTVLIIAHRDRLISQAKQKWLEAHPEDRVGIEMADQRTDDEPYDCIVSSVQTLKGVRLSKFVETHGSQVCFIVTDECHHSTEPSYTAIFEEFRCLPVDMQTGLRPLENQSAPVLLGVTATPKRLDKHLLEDVYPFSTYDYPLLDAMREKYLCAVKAFRVETDVDLRGIKQQSGEFNQRELAERVDVKDRVDLVVKQWKKLGGMKRRTADFCTSKAQCHSHAAEYRKHTPNVYVITEEVKGAVREAMLEEFSWGPLPQVVISVDVMTEGTDIAQLDMIVNSAPTKSASRFIQRIGRGLRPYVGGSNPSTAGNPTWPSVLPVKDHLLFLDIVDTVRSQSDLMTVPRILGLPASFDLRGDDLLEAKNVMDEILNRDPALEAALKTMAETDEKMPKTFKELKAELQRIMLFAPNNPRGKSKEYSTLAWLAADERAIMDNDADNSHAYVLNVAAPRDPKPGEVAQQRALRLEYRPVSGFWFIMIQAPNPERTALEREAAYNVNQAKRYDIPVQYKGQFYAKAKAANQAAARLPLVTLKEMQLYPDLDRSIVHIDGYVRKRHPSALHLLELNAAWRRKMPSSGQLYFAKSAQIPVHPDMRAGDVSDLINNHKNLKVHEESL